MNEKDLRLEAVRRRLAGENAEDIAVSLGRTTRWVRKWVARHAEEGASDGWADGRSRVPHTSPTRTPEHTRALIVSARQQLEAMPHAQYGALAIEWQLRRMGVDPLPKRWTIERTLAAEGLTKPRRRGTRYQAKGVPYPAPLDVVPGSTHQIDLVGPRHLEGGYEFHALNVIDVGSHTAASEILDFAVPRMCAFGLVAAWSKVGVPAVAQFDNHTRFRGGIPPASTFFGPVVAMCLDLGVTPRFVPLREPWRNGLVERFNDVWDKSFFRTARYNNPDHLRDENRTFIEFHNDNHRYSAHRGQTPNEVMAGRATRSLSIRYQPPTRLPARGRIEAVRFIRSDRVVNLWGRNLLVEEHQTHQYVTAIVKVRSKQVIVVDRHGEIIIDDQFPIARELR